MFFKNHKAKKGELIVNEEERRAQYLEVSHAYFNKLLSVDQLISELREITEIRAEKIDLPKDERIMLIANHPKADGTLTLPATDISDLKGGNTENFPSFWFPVIRQILLKDALVRRFVTIAHDIGWNVAMHQLWHYPITPTPGGRCRTIVDSLERDPDCSVVIFPEGGARGLRNFHTGFFYIAQALGIKKLVTASITPMLSLNTENTLKVIQVEDISSITGQINKIVNDKKDLLINSQ